jgi:TRAP-type C4-dicarboxylate transport system permease small subunit
MKRLQALFASVASLALFAMMLLTFADVFSRKFLSNSITGAVELTELMMLVMIFFALPLASLASEHIVFDLLDRLMPPALLRWQMVLANAITSAIFASAAWVVHVRALRTAEFGDVTSALEIRLSPFHELVAVMLALTALIHLVLAWRDARRPPTPQPGAAAHPIGDGA